MRQALLFLLLLLASGSALAQKRGDWVLARWQGGPYWFPGIIEKVAGGKITVLFDDGDRETLPISQVKAYDWREGSRIECRWADSSQWYGTKIERIENDRVTLHVVYDDGVSEKTLTSFCRSR